MVYFHTLKTVFSSTDKCSKQEYCFFAANYINNESEYLSHEINCPQDGRVELHSCQLVSFCHNVITINFLIMGARDSLSVVRYLECEVDHSHPSGATMKNVCSFTSNPITYIHSMVPRHKHNFLYIVMCMKCSGEHTDSIL